MFRIGFSSGSRNTGAKEFEAMGKAGISDIEISRDYLEEAFSLDFKDIKKTANACGLNVWSFHLPYAPENTLCIETLDKELRKKSIQDLSELIKRASDAGIDKMVIHGNMHEPITDDVREEMTNCARESLFTLAEVADKAGSVIAVEDLPRTCLGNCSKDLMKLISVHDKLKVCFDVNHLLNESHKDFVENLGNKIITTHISDYDFINERHWLPGEGDIDWVELIDLLKSINYNGVFLYELPFTIDTIERERPLCYEDYVKNAKELFSKHKLTTFWTKKIV